MAILLKGPWRWWYRLLGRKMPEEVGPETPEWVKAIVADSKRMERYRKAGVGDPQRGYWRKP